MQRLPRPAAIAGALLVTVVTAVACERTDSPLAADRLDAAYARGFEPSADINRQLAALRQATAQFHNFEKADSAGYKVEVTPCWEHVQHGAQGYHFGREDLLRDGVVNLLEPELLMYEAQPGGRMRLVGIEYIVFSEDLVGPIPSLLGRTFEPHSFLPIYKLHVWLGRENPEGMFSDWNPKVSCDHAAEREYFE